MTNPTRQTAATPYRRAANQERRLAHTLTQLGHDVIRAAGSHGAFDLLATRAGHSLAISAKRDRHSISPAEWHALWTLHIRHDWTPLIADMTGPRHTTRLWELRGDKPRNAPIDHWLSEYELQLHAPEPGYRT